MTEFANFFPALLGLMLGVIGLVSAHVAKRNYERRGRPDRPAKHLATESQAIDYAPFSRRYARKSHD